MDTILASVTAVSLALAGCMAFVLARLVREERRRSDARVALLTELASTESTEAPVRRAAVRVASRTRTDPSSVSAAVLDDFEIRRVEAPSPVGASFFQPHQEPSAWPMRLVAAAAIVAVVTGVVFGWAAVRSKASRTSTEVATAPGAQPLELLSLAHQQQGAILTISGLVQNPRNATPLSRVEAAVAAFDADGKLLASGRAPLDFTTLGPGDESPFILRVAADGATRYRVSFRTDNDQPLAHVDRRNLARLRLTPQEAAPR